METVNYQCPTCAGPLQFVAETQMLHCDFCQMSFSIEEIDDYYEKKQAQADAKAEEQAEKQAQAQNKAESEEQTGAIAEDATAPDSMKSYTCSSCGAELICEATTAATHCPYCNNPTVIPGQLSSTFKPDYIIPFKTTKEDAVRALNGYYKGKKFLSKKFSNANHVEKIQGVYVPFWLYDADITGNATFEATNVRTIETRRETITKTDYFNCVREGSLSFNRVPTDASTKMPNTHMDAIEPFNYDDLKDFSIAYMPGFLADRFDQDAQECQNRAFSRMKRSFEAELRNTVDGYMSVSTIDCDSQIMNESTSYALLPVWMLHTSWNGKSFLFAMNGQTGKFIGDLPISKGRFATYFALIAAVTTAATFLGLLALL